MTNLFSQEPWARRGEDDARIQSLETSRTADEATLASILAVLATSPADRTGVSLRRAGTQSVSSSTPTAVSWDTEDFDSDEFITSPSATITVPPGAGGLYAITVRGHWSAQPSGRAFISVVAGAADYRVATDDEDEFTNPIPIIPLAATNTVVINVFQTSAGALDFTGQLFMYRLSG